MKKLFTILLSCLLVVAVGAHVSFSKTIEKQKFGDSVKLTKTGVSKFESPKLFDIDDMLVRCIRSEALYSTYISLEKPLFKATLLDIKNIRYLNRNLGAVNSRSKQERISYHNKV